MLRAGPAAPAESDPGAVSATSRASRGGVYGFAPTWSSACAIACWCYVKMSWGNCYVKVSCPHGDFHVEPEGVASSRAVDGGQRGPDHQWPGGDGAASQCPPSPATQ